MFSLWPLLTTSAESTTLSSLPLSYASRLPNNRATASLKLSLNGQNPASIQPRPPGFQTSVEMSFPKQFIHTMTTGAKFHCSMLYH